MVFLGQIAVLLAACSTIAVAAPSAEKKPAGRFTVPQVRKSKKPVPPAAEMLKTFMKYNLTIPADVKQAAQTGTVVANPTPNDDSYICQVSVGQSTLTLDFDTGSSDLWVFSNQLPSSEIGSHSVYVPSSNAQQLQGYSWNIQYADSSSASGDVYLDVVTVGGATVNQQAVEAAEQISQAFINGPSDGLLGLGFNSINTVSPQKQATFFSNVMPSLEQPLFTSSLKHGQPGSYDFGYIDSTKYTGQITYTNIDNSNGWWTFNVDSWSGGGASGGSLTGIADTGTSLLYLPQDVVQNYYSGVQGAQYSSSQGGYVFPCSVTPPDFTVTISGYQATIPGAFMNYAGDGTTCFGGLQVGSDGSNVFGDIFLKSQFVVWNGQTLQLGFAPQA